MNTQQHEQRLEQLEEARKLWQESEWRLNFLRTETGTPTPAPTEQEILQWYHQHQR
jgi:hypothetical protein